MIVLLSRAYAGTLSLSRCLMIVILSSPMLKLKLRAQQRENEHQPVLRVRFALLLQVVLEGLPLVALLLLSLQTFRNNRNFWRFLSSSKLVWRPFRRRRDGSKMLKLRFDPILSAI